MHGVRRQAMLLEICFSGMFKHMRTTLNVPDHLIVAAKQLAAERRTTLTAIIQESLRNFLAEERAKAGRASLAELPVNSTAVPVGGVDLTDTSALLEVE